MATASAEIRKLKAQVRRLEQQTQRLKVYAKKNYLWENRIVRARLSALLRKMRPKGPPNVTPPPPPPR
jgi:hypothetical protein